MLNNRGIFIAGTGSYLPEKVVTNTDLAGLVDTSDEWIQTRTGIRERRLAAADQPTSALAAAAAEQALAAAGVSAEQVDLIIVATLSPDHQFPNTACFVQKRIGAGNAACFSLEAACTGFLYAFEVAVSMMACSAHYRNVLVIGGEKMSSLVDWTDRTTCVLFGDGAGAVLLQRDLERSATLLASRLGADGNLTDILQVPAGGSAMPITVAVLEQHLQFLSMNGREIFKLAVNAMVSAAENVLSECNLSIDQVRWLIPHQANLRIINGVGKRLGIDNERVFVNVDRYGNTSAATIPIALDEIVRSGSIERGDYILLVAFGGGLTWGAQLLQW